MPPKKPAERRHNAKTRDVGRVSQLPVRVAARVMPPPDIEWSDEVQAAWLEFWSSPLADPKVLRSTDVPALRRLFDLRARLDRAQSEFDDCPTVSGSMGQTTMSPWAAEVHRLEAAIGKLEDKFGLTPMSRLRLGVTFEEGVSLASRNAAFLAQFEDKRRAR
jgi:hypothetical protein